MPFVERTVDSSDLLLYNKTAKVPRERVLAFRRRATQVNPDILVAESRDMPASGLPPLFQMHLDPRAIPVRTTSAVESMREELSHDHGHLHLGEADGMSAAVCARQWMAKNPVHFDIADAAAFLGRLSEALQNAGARMIGHLKLLAEGTGRDYIAASVTAFENAPETTGQWAPDAKMCTLTVNAIVYGLSTETLAIAVSDAFRTLREDGGDQFREQAD
jgi:G3E family GTPase